MRARMLLAVVTLLCPIWSPAAKAESVLRAVMHSDLKILDPVWSAAQITRIHGYLVYDTLFATDTDGQIKPQMVDRTTISDDGLVYTFTLRDGLSWHDGTQVTSEDCIASIKRWSVRDTLGQQLMGYVQSFSATDAKTFTLTLTKKIGIVLAALGKPGGSVPFMMPKRIAETDPNKQIAEFVGSGPFMFKREEWQPGHRAVYIKAPMYKPRPEAPSGLAGGKEARLDRIEWHYIPDPQQAINALLAGEVDFIEGPPIDLHPVLKKSSDIKLTTINTLGAQYQLRPNWRNPPFDNEKVREVLWYALNQDDVLRSVTDDPAYSKSCKSIWICGTTFAKDDSLQGRLSSDFARARQLLADANYDGTPIVVLHVTDLPVLGNLAPVTKSLLEKAGFKVNMQSMDWQTLLSRVSKYDGWHVFLTSYSAQDLSDPLVALSLNAACEKARTGWPCDAQIESLRSQYVLATDEAEKKRLAHEVERRAIQVTTHVPLGQYYWASASRRNVTGILQTPVTVFWSMTKG